MASSPDRLESLQESLRTKPLPEIEEVLFGGAHSALDRLAAVFAVDSLELPLEAKANLLVRCLEDSDPEVQRGAVFFLGWLSHPIVIERLECLLDDESPILQREIVRSLARLGDSEVHPRCAQFLLAESEDDRMCAIVSLGLLGRQEDLAVLETCWNEGRFRDRIERLAAALILAKKQAPAVEQFLEEELPQNSEWQVHIATALAGLSNQKGLEELRRLLTQCPECDTEAILQCFAEYLGIRLSESEDWRAAALAWIDAKRLS
jgi:HEAT repeat protein